jgi:hypothetical protein
LGSHQNDLIHRVLTGKVDLIQRVVVEVENPPISHPKYTKSLQLALQAFSFVAARMT